jgi:hypothetical protein
MMQFKKSDLNPAMSIITFEKGYGHEHCLVGVEEWLG